MCFQDPHTLHPLPGITVGDMGQKLGFEGVDNGFALFDHVRIPRENLLNRTGDVTHAGNYRTPYKVRHRRLALKAQSLQDSLEGVGDISEEPGVSAPYVRFCFLNVHITLHGDTHTHTPDASKTSPSPSKRHLILRNELISEASGI